MDSRTSVKQTIKEVEALTPDSSDSFRVFRVFRGSNSGSSDSGGSIELDEELRVADGQEVEVQVKVIPKIARMPGEGFLCTEGALADDTEWDSIIEEIHQARKLERRPQSPGLGEP